MTLSGVEKVSAFGPSRKKFFGFFKNKKVITAIIIIILAIGAYEAYENHGHETIHVAPKSDTEPYILGYMLEELIEGNTYYKLN